MPYAFDEVHRITKELVAIPSIVREPFGETNCANAVADYYKRLPYFEQNPHQVKTFATKEEGLSRHSTYAYVKGTGGSSARTVILIGHIDTVGVDDYGRDRTLPFDCDRIPEALQQLAVSQQVLDDIASGEYLFGRGALDMKSGVAGHMFLIKYFSEHPEELDGNLIAIAECDEEDNSSGIIAALDELDDLRVREGFCYIACVNADYTTGYFPHDNGRYVYLGSIGKQLPSVYATGKETHVGQPFGGFDPNLLVAEITRRISLNTELCDTAHGETCVPPISLKQADFKEGYTVQTALAAYAYYNFFSYSTSPMQVMEQFQSVVGQSFEAVIEMLDCQYRVFCEKSGASYAPLPWKKRIYTWEELYQELSNTHGDTFCCHIAGFAAKLHKEQPQLDLRLFSVQVIEEALTFMSDKSPMAVLFFGSIFSSRVEVSGKTQEERNLTDALKQAVEAVQPSCPDPIHIKMFYPYIADASYLSISDSPEDIAAMLRNMPAHGSKYHYPLEKILAVNVPVVNIGAQGWDGHQLTERVHMRYTFEHVPNMTYHVIRKLLSAQ